MDLSLNLPSESSDHVSPLPSITINFKAPDASNETYRSTNLSKINSIPDRMALDMGTGRSDRENETLLGKPDGNMTVLDAEPRQVDLSYADCLIKERNIDKLVQKFMNEPSKLKVSRAKDYSYSIKDCSKRLKIENPIKLVDPIIFPKLRRSKTPLNHELLKAVISVDKTAVKILNAYNCYMLKFSSISGVLLGNSAYNFQHLSQIGVEYRETDCMTLVTEYRSYDIVVLDDTLRYDLYLLLSWQISNYSKKTSSVPLSKQQMSAHIVRSKIKEMASEKLLFKNELILLAIFKTLIQTNAEKEKRDKVWNLLQRFMLLPQKILRIFYLMKPRNFHVTEKFKEKFDFQIRNRALQARIADKAINKYPTKVLKPEITPNNYFSISKRNIGGLFSRRNDLSRVKTEQPIVQKVRFEVLKQMDLP